MGTKSRNNKSNSFKFATKRKEQLNVLLKTIESINTGKYRLGLLRKSKDYRTLIRIDVPFEHYKLEKELIVHQRIIGYDCVIIYEDSFDFKEKEITPVRSRHLIHNIKKHVGLFVLPHLLYLVEKCKLDLRMREPTEEEAIKRETLHMQNLHHKRLNSQNVVRRVVIRDYEQPESLKEIKVVEEIVRKRKKASQSEQNEKLDKVKSEWFKNPTIENNLITFRVNKHVDDFMSGANNIKNTPLLETEDFSIFQHLYTLKVNKDGKSSAFTEKQLDKIRRRELHEETVRKQAEAKVKKALETQSRLAEEAVKRKELREKQRLEKEFGLYMWEKYENA